MLYDKTAKMEFPVPIVTPLWVSTSQQLGYRAMVSSPDTLSLPSPSIPLPAFSERRPGKSRQTHEGRHDSSEHVVFPHRAKHRALPSLPFPALVSSPLTAALGCS